MAERSKKGTCVRELKEAAAAVAAAVETLAKRVQLPLTETVEEEMDKFRKEIRELKYNLSITIRRCSSNWHSAKKN